MKPTGKEPGKPISILKKVKIHDPNSERLKHVSITAGDLEPDHTGRDFELPRNSRPNKLVGSEEYFTAKKKERVDQYVRWSAVISTGYFVVSGALSGLAMENSNDLFKPTCKAKSRTE